MATIRRSAATLAVAGAGAAVMFLQWWAPLVALPALLLAAGLDPEVRSGDHGGAGAGAPDDARGRTRGHTAGEDGAHRWMSARRIGA